MIFDNVNHNDYHKFADDVIVIPIIITYSENYDNDIKTLSINQMMSESIGTLTKRKEACKAKGNLLEKQV